MMASLWFVRPFNNVGRGSDLSDEGLPARVHFPLLGYLKSVEFSKILFAKFSSKIVFKISRVKFVEKLKKKCLIYFEKVLGEFLEMCEMYFVRFCEKFAKMLRIFEEIFAVLLEIDTEQILRTIKKFSVTEIPRLSKK